MGVAGKAVKGLRSIGLCNYRIENSQILLAGKFELSRFGTLLTLLTLLAAHYSHYLLLTARQTPRE